MSTSTTKIKRTKKAIRTGFLQLVREKHVSTITVKELTELAEINRSTFYAYYNSVEDLGREIETELANSFVEKVGSSPVDTATAREKVLTDSLRLFMDNDSRVVWLYRENTFGICEAMVQEYCKATYYPIWRQVSNRTDAELDVYFKMLYASAVAFFRELHTEEYRKDEPLLSALYNDYMEALFLLMFDRDFIKNRKKSSKK